MKNIIRLMISLFFIYNGIIVAAPYLTITKSNSISFPSHMLVSQAGVGDYIVTNVSGKAQTIHVRDLPAGFSVATATGASPANCGNSSLANNASCTLRLSYESFYVTTVSQLLPAVCPTAQYNIGCVTPATATSFSVVSSPSDDMTTLSTSSDVVLFAPGQTTQLIVTNNGSVTANSVQINLPPQLSQYLVSGAVTQCAILAPAATCTLSLPMSSSLPINDTPYMVSVGASNAPTVSVDAEVSGGLATASSILFSTPGTQSITVTNEGLAITGLSIDSISLSGVSANGGTCGSTLGENASCTYNYIATSGAHGSATATIHYTQAHVDKTTTATIAVANTSVAINPNGSDQGQDIPGDTTNRIGSFTVKNTGNFNWLSPSVTRSPEDSWLTLDASACTASAVAPGASCTVTYAIGGLFDLSSAITATGTNIAETSQNFDPDEYISIGIESNSAYRHLGYEAVKVTNLTSLSETLSGITAAPPSALSSQVTLCDATGSNCGGSTYASYCLTGSLAAGATCHLWYQANAGSALSAATTASVDVTVSATPTGGSANPLSRNLTFTYENDLYAGGIFTTAGGVNANRIAKWDGSTWSTVSSSGMNAEVSALTVVKGDVYAAGKFTSAGGTAANYIAEWDGTTWSALGSGLNNEVDGLAFSDSQLYVGGHYTTAGGSTANRMAIWDVVNKTWIPMSTGMDTDVYTVAVLNGIVYAGGPFTTAGGNNAHNVAQWNGTTWSAVGTGLYGGIVYALGTSNGVLYAGGNFFDNGSGTSMPYIAKWDGTNWSRSGTVSSIVQAFGSLNNELYIGGNFTRVNNSNDPAASIAKWNGNTYSALGSTGLAGGTGVYAIATLGNSLYAAGAFNTADGNPASLIAVWNSQSNAWSALGAGFNVNGLPFALTIAPSLSLS